jgi:hypothetical protein
MKADDILNTTTNYIKAMPQLRQYTLGSHHKRPEFNPRGGQDVS